jgi:hypothetical protein
MRAALMWTINDFPAYGMVSGWSMHGKLTCTYCMENNKAFTLTNGGKASFFYCHRCFLPHNHRYRKNRKDFFVGRVEKDVAPPRISGEELFDVVSEYGDIVFGLQSGKQKFPDFGLTCRSSQSQPQAQFNGDPTVHRLQLHRCTVSAFTP